MDLSRAGFAWGCDLGFWLGCGSAGGHQGVHSRGAVNWCQQTAGSGGSQGFPVSASRMASSAVMPWAAAESR